MLTTQQKAALKRWRNPEYRAKQLKTKKDEDYLERIRKSATKAANRPEVKKNKGRCSRRRWKDPEYKSRVAKAISKGLKKVSGKLSLVQLAIWEDPKKRANRIAYRMTERGRQENSQAVSKAWRTPKTRRNLLAACRSDKERTRRSVQASQMHKEAKLGQKHPNMSEVFVLSLLVRVDKRFEFVGNNRFWVENCNPDFVLRKLNLLVEFNCSYWHQDMKAEARRKRIFKKAGYKLLVLDETDTAKKNIDKTIRKIERFVSRYGNPEPSSPKGKVK